MPRQGRRQPHVLDHQLAAAAQAHQRPALRAAAQPLAAVRTPMTKTTLLLLCNALALACAPRTSDESRSSEHALVPAAASTAGPTAAADTPEAQLRKKLL